MTVLGILSRALGGALLVNAVPHGVNGVQGKPFPSPFADPPGVGMSPPAVNVAWSATNLAAALFVLRRGIRSPGEAVAVFVGMTAGAFVLASHFGSVMAGGTGLRSGNGGSSSRPAVQRWSEPLARRLSGRPWMPLWAVIHHRGRRSGTAYDTPIAIVPTLDDTVILIGLPWGIDTNWARNVVAAGGATLTWKGAEVDAMAPRIIPAAEAAALAKAPFDAVVRRMPGAIAMTRVSG